MTMEEQGTTLAFLVPELISKGLRSLEQLHAAACTGHKNHRGESLVRAFKLFQPTPSKGKAEAASYLALVQDAVDRRWHDKQRERLDNNSGGGGGGGGGPSASVSRAASAVARVKKNEAATTAVGVGAAGARAGVAATLSSSK